MTNALVLKSWRRSVLMLSEFGGKSARRVRCGVCGRGKENGGGPAAPRFMSQTLPKSDDNVTVDLRDLRQQHNVDRAGGCVTIEI